MKSKWKVDNFEFLENNAKIKKASKVSLSNNSLNKRFSIYDGKKFISIIVRDYMLNKKLSSFVSSKFTGKAIHVKRKKRKK